MSIDDDLSDTADNTRPNADKMITPENIAGNIIDGLNNQSGPDLQSKYETGIDRYERERDREKRTDGNY